MNTVIKTEKLKFSYYDEETKTLTITGTGAMFDYTATTRPWEAFEDEITTVVIGDDVTSIGKLAFYHFALLTDVDMGGVTTIGINAFNVCKALKPDCENCGIKIYCSFNSKKIRK